MADPAHEPGYVHPADDPFWEFKHQLMGRFERGGVDPARVTDLDDVDEDDDGVWFTYVTGSDRDGYPDPSAGTERRHLPNEMKDRT